MSVLHSDTVNTILVEQFGIRILYNTTTGNLKDYSCAFHAVSVNYCTIAQLQLIYYASVQYFNTLHAFIHDHESNN